MSLIEKEFFSAMTHFIGAIVFGIYGLLLIRRTEKKYRWSVNLFVATSFTLLLMSGIYHFLDAGKIKGLFKILDHCAIFILIGGSFTVFHDIVFLQNRYKKIIFSIFWIVVAIFVTIKIVWFFDLSENISFGMYFFLGWTGVFSVFFMIKKNGFQYVKLIVYGGLLYTIGGLIDYHNQQLLEIHPHVIFHIFVLLALLVHFNFITSQVKNIPNRVNKMTHDLNDKVEEILTEPAKPEEPESLKKE